MEDKNLKRHPDQGRIVRRIQRPCHQSVEALSQCYSAFILDYLGKQGAMDVDILPLKSGMRCCGPAVTCLGPDLSIRRMAIDLADPGDVLIVAAGGVKDYACFGDGTAKRMMLKSMAGVVIDGATRDSTGLKSLGFPTFVRAVTPRNYHYPVSSEYGAVNVPVVCGGVLVNPGDIIFGDDDGVVVVHREVADQISKTIVADLKAEESQRLTMTTYEPFCVENELRARGYKFE